MLCWYFVILLREQQREQLVLNIPIYYALQNISAFIYIYLNFLHLPLLKYDWDIDIGHEIETQWNEFLKDLLALTAVSVRHHVLCCTQMTVELHGFCDSSDQAHCAVVFVRVACSHRVSATLWMGNCQLAPMKNFSITRLELLSYLLISNAVGC